MANVNSVKSKDTTITLLDGVKRSLKFDLNAMAELEDRYGSVDAAFDALDKQSIKALRFILWAGLAHADESLTEQKVGSLIDMSCLQEIMQTLGAAFDSDMPNEDDSTKALTGADTNPNE